MKAYKNNAYDVVGVGFFYMTGKIYQKKKLPAGLSKNNFYQVT